MKRFLFFSLVTTIALCFTLPAAAQIYKYTTKEGQTFYTNDPNQVPHEYRDQVENMYETQPPASDNTATQPAADEPSMYANPELEVRRAKLETEKALLEKLYADLSVRKATLEEQRQTVSVDDPESLKAYNDTITQLNQEVAAYQTRTDTYNKELRTFNMDVINQSEKQ